MSLSDQINHSHRLSELINGEVRFARADRLLYATDASLYQVEPIGVVVPANLDDVARTLEYCRAHGLPVLPRGAGTSLAGQCVNQAVVIDFSVWCNRLLDVDEAGRTCRIEPGVVLDELNHEVGLRTGGRLWFGPDVATSRHANLGGMIGNNSSGTRSIMYGRTVDHVLSITARLADGEEHSFRQGAGRDDSRIGELTQQIAGIVLPIADLIRERFPKTKRRVNGYNLDLILDQIERSTPGTLDCVNLAALLCGSEGTLAITTEATLRLVDRPQCTGLVIASFDSLNEAVAAVNPILETNPSAVELLDDLLLQLASDHREYKPIVDRLPPAPSGRSASAVLYIEYFGDSVDEVIGAVDRLDSIVPVRSRKTYHETSDKESAWALRKAGEPLLHGIAGERKPIAFIEDTAVDPEHLPDFVAELRALIESHGTRACFYAHASVGCLHVRPLLDPHDERDLHTMREMARQVTDLVKRYHGALSGEHGDGRVRGPLLERFYGPEIVEAFRQIKALFDPENRLNPGNIVRGLSHSSEFIDAESLRSHRLKTCATACGTFSEPEPMTMHLRVRPNDQFVSVDDQIETQFDYGGDCGFAHAVELCNGAGVCRKKAVLPNAGTMCPSYMATLDEGQSTRGRANLLRLALTGQLNQKLPDSESVRFNRSASLRSHRLKTCATAHGLKTCSSDRDRLEACPTAGRWNDPDVLGALDLCLSCKACKSECPSGVDLARLKAEYLSQSYREAGSVPMRARILGRIDRINRLGSAVAPLSRLLMNVGPIRGLVGRVLGLASERSLPDFARSIHRNVVSYSERATTVREWSGKEIGSTASFSRLLSGRLVEPVVILYADCFSAYNEPNVALSVVHVLEAFGYRVVVPRVPCCGRAMISMGLLDEARRSAQRAARMLLETVDRTDAVGIVVPEPSCLASIHDEWLALRLGIERCDLEHLAEISSLPEQFVEDRWTLHPHIPRAFQSEIASGKRVALHGHCHQKSLWGVESSAALLQRLLGADRVDVLDTGCCGMAGAFGFFREHYDLSMEIGELSLFPAVRDMDVDLVTVLTPGTSCRHQIRGGTGVVAVHPIEFVDSLITPSPVSAPDQE